MYVPAVHAVIYFCHKKIIRKLSTDGNYLHGGFAISGDQPALFQRSEHRRVGDIWRKAERTRRSATQMRFCLFDIHERNKLCRAAIDFGEAHFVCTLRFSFT